MQIEITDRDREFAAELDDMPRHFGAIPRPGKVALTADWRIRIAAEDPVARCGAESLTAFLSKYCGLALPVTVGGEAAGPEVSIRWDGGSGEGFTLKAASSGVEIRGDSSAGALYGAHRLQWMMCMNGGPYLERGTTRIEPRAAVRITATPFRQPFDDGNDPMTYTDGYLDLMAHYGFNGIHMYIDIFEYVQAPGFENAHAAERIAAMADLARRASRYNIGIYIHPNVTRRHADDPILAAHPELRGAQSCLPGMTDYYCCCSSEPLTMRLYADTLKGIIRQSPGVKGVIAIIGGECLLHCYSAPTSRELSGTNCPRCAQRKPSEVVADFANSIARPVWDEFPDCDFMVWPYSGHVWSESYEQRELIAMLDQRMGFLTCYEKDAWVEIDGHRHSIFDYNISYVGPSERYVIQRDLCAFRGLPFYIKTESSISLELLSVPYVPVMVSWRKRWRGMMKDRPRGVLANWRFTGLSGTLSEETAYHETWKAKSDGHTLARIATRLAGDQGCYDLIIAWRIFSRSYSKLSLCAGLIGAPYFMGPMFLGPAHPLVFSSEEVDRLPEGCVSFDVCYVETERGAEVDSIPRSPRFFADTAWTQPLGLPKIRRMLDSICCQWDIGLDRCARALDRAPAGSRPNLQSEIDVALMTGVMLKATRNLARFQLERERAMVGGLSPSGFRGCRRRLQGIVNDDLANSRLGLELAERNHRYGYGFVYGKHFDADLIRAKIDFTERVLLPDIANAEPSAIE